MPGIKGAQLVEAIRSEWPDISAILATGYAELPAGITANVHRLAKPFTQADLAQAISTTAARPDEGRVVPFRKGEPNSPLRGEEVRGNAALGHCVVPKRSARHSTLGGSG